MKKLITLLFTGLCVTVANAQWNPITDQNLLVEDPASGSSFSATTNDGKTFIGFWKKVSAPTNFELRVQILDAAGVKQLGNDGVLLSNQIPMSTYTVFERTAVDAAGNFYIGVTGTGTGTPAYVFKVSPQGVSQWPNGINIGAGYIPTILPLSNGDIVTGYMSTSLPHMQMQRYNALGQPVWTNPVGIAATDVSKVTAPADFFELSNNEIGVVFHQRLTGTGSYLYAQKLDFNGNILWTAPTQISDQTTSYNTVYSGVVDGDVMYYGFASGQGNRYDSYLQKINADGTIPWGPHGVDFDTNKTNFEKNMRIAFTPGSQNIWAIATYTPSGQGSGGEYVQKFDKTTGNQLFTVNAKQVFPISADFMIHTGNLHLVDDAPYFVVEKRINTTLLPSSLNAVLLDDNGDFAWAQQYIPLATFNASKGYVNVLKPINNQAVIVFQEKKTADANEKIYAQALVLPPPILAVNDFAFNNQIKLFPNPATNVIYLDGVNNTSFSIYNTLGQLVKSGQTQNGEILIDQLQQGQYILKLKGIAKEIKFIKK